MIIEAPELTAGKVPPTELGDVPNPLNIAVLISNQGEGSNLQAIIDAGFKVSLVISDKPDAKGLQKAEKNGIFNETMELVYPQETTQEEKKKVRDAYARTLAEYLNLNGIHVVVLAGFMTILSPSFFDAFQGVAINIHPGAIPYAEDRPYFTDDGKESPWNQRKATNEAVGVFIDKGLRYAVSTVHVVTAEPDFGPVLGRAIVEIDKGDTVETLYPRLKEDEHRIVVEVLKKPGGVFARAGKAFPKKK